MSKILVIGAAGQLGTDLTAKLREIYGESNVFASDIKPPNAKKNNFFFQLDISDKKHFNQLIEKHNIEEVYHLAATLSAKGEKNPLQSWNFNINSLLTVLEAGRNRIKKIFWPSSIAVFGPNTPKINTPQYTITLPTSAYGISKLAGEYWCLYYYHTYGVDVRSLRYPGLIGHAAPPGGGTTDYAIDIFHKAIAKRPFYCYLNKNTTLPMMYIDDGVRAAIEVMQAEKDKMIIGTSYNIHAMSFSPIQLFQEIRKHFPSFEINYQPDYRQNIADGWPESIDDQVAKKDWGWKAKFDLASLVNVMIEKLTERRINQ